MKFYNGKEGGCFLNFNEPSPFSKSMSRVGKCIDNGPMEGFFGILKCEKYHLNKYDNYLDLEKDIEDYIIFYNNGRLQKKLNCQSPVEFRAMAA